MTNERMIEILAKAARRRLDLLEDGETSLAYYGEEDEIRAALALHRAGQPAITMSIVPAKPGWLITPDCPQCGPTQRVVIEREPSAGERGVYRCTDCGGSFEAGAMETV